MAVPVRAAWGLPDVGWLLGEDASCAAADDLVGPTGSRIVLRVVATCRSPFLKRSFAPRVIVNNTKYDPRLFSQHEHKEQTRKHKGKP